MTMDKNIDPNHNEFFDSAELLERNYRKAMEQQGVSIPKDSSSGKFASVPDESPDSSFFIHSDPRKVAPEQQAMSRDAGNDSKMGKMASQVKMNAIEIFKKVSGTELSKEVESLIGQIEKMERVCGIDSEKFDPLRHMSGLKIREPLENANRVVDNTMANYDMHIIDSIESRLSANRPSIAISVVGSQKQKGFLARSVIVAKRDFSGSEAIDYVHSSPRGLFSIKRFEKDRWVDASEDFSIRHKIVEFDLEMESGMDNTAFLGEKIASSGKGMIMKELNLTDKDVKFGERQVFSSDSEVIDKIIEFVKGRISR
jgi:hypothetical protein